MPRICRSARLREDLINERAHRAAAEARAADEHQRRVALEQQLERKDDSERRKPLGLSETLLSSFTLAGLLLYGVAVFGYRAFYGTFGVDPEEAGLTYSQIVAQAALGATIVIFAIVLLLAWRYSLVSRLRTWEGQFLVLYVISVTVIVALSFNGGIRVTVLCIGILSCVSIPVGYWTWRRKGGKVLISLIVLFSLISLLGAPIAIGTEVANEIKHGQLETPMSLWGLLRVRVRLVDVKWTGEPPDWADPSVHCYYYLGEENGVILLYDSQHRVTHRLSLEGAIGVTLSTCAPPEAITDISATNTLDDLVV